MAHLITKKLFLLAVIPKIIVLLIVGLGLAGCNYSETAPESTVSTQNAEATSVPPTIPTGLPTPAPPLPTHTPSATLTGAPTTVSTKTPTSTSTNTPLTAPVEPPATRTTGQLLPEEVAALTGLVVCNEQGEVFVVNEAGNLVSQPNLLRAGEFHFNGNIYMIRNSDVWIKNGVDNNMQPLIETEGMDEQIIYGRLGEWLLVRAFLAGQEHFQSPGPIFLLKLDGSEYRLLVDDSAIGQPLLSEDGTLAIISTQDEVWLIDEDLTKSSPFDQHFYFGAISPNNQYVAHNEGAGLGISDLAAGTLIAAHETGGGSLTLGNDALEPFQWSPDNEWVAALTIIQAEPPDSPFQLLIVNIITGETQTIANAWNPRWHPDSEVLLFATNPPNPRIQLLRFSEPSLERVETGYEGLAVGWMSHNHLQANSYDTLPLGCQR